MKTESIIFDLDGTLIDSSAGIEHSARQAVARVLPGVTLPSLRPFIGPPIREVLRLALEETPGLVAAGALAELEREFRADYDTVGWRLSVPCDGAASTLAELTRRDKRCFVVTNKPAFAAVCILRELGLSRRLADILSRDSRRPAFASKAEAVEHLLDRHDIDPQAAVLVGDSRDDADAARLNDLRFVAAIYGYGLTRGNSQDADAMIDGLRQLPSVIDRLEMTRRERPQIHCVQRAMT